MMNHAVHFITPGEVIRRAYLKPSGLSEQELADLLGITHAQLEGLLDGGSKITPEIAVSLSRIFDTYVEYWWALQDQMEVGSRLAF